MKYFYLILIVFIFGCNSTPDLLNEEKIKEEVWKTVLAHNHSWAVLENISELEKYVSDSIISISPPFKKVLKGKKNYLNAYQDYVNAATIYSFEERNIEIELLLNGTMAIVTFEISMSFEYNGQEVPEWKGRDLMTLKHENGKWLICSDMFVQYPD